MKRTHFAALAAALCAGLLMAAPATAKSCKAREHRAPYEGRTTAKLKVSAVARATARWEFRMTKLYGAGWAHWPLAVGKRHACNRSGGNWHCVAYARPCHP